MRALVFIVGVMECESFTALIKVFCLDDAWHADLLERYSLGFDVDGDSCLFRFESSFIYSDGSDDVRTAVGRIEFNVVGCLCAGLNQLTVVVEMYGCDSASIGS